MHSHRYVAGAGEGKANEKSSGKSVKQANEASSPGHAVRGKKLDKQREIGADGMTTLKKQHNCRRTNSATQKCSYTGPESHRVKLCKRLRKDFSGGRVSKAQRPVTEAKTTVDVVSESPSYCAKGELKSAFDPEEPEERDMQQNEERTKQQNQWQSPECEQRAER